MPNTIAFAVLLLWPLVMLKLRKRYSLQTGVVLAFMLPFLLLPVKTKIDLPLIPPIDKTAMAALSAFFAYIIIGKQKLIYLPKETAIRRLIIVLFISPLFTIFTNNDALYYGVVALPAMSVKDYISLGFSNFVTLYLPFIFGATYFAREADMKKLFIVFATVGLAYTLLVLWEIRMSPQLHKQIYGFFPHDFQQMKRQDGFRATVFIGHGLLIAMFLAMLSVATFVLWRSGHKKLMKVPMFLAVLLVLGALVLNKSLGSLIFIGVALPCIYFLSCKKQVLAATVIAMCVFIFPFLRAELIPVNDIVEFFKTKDEERAQSLGFRIDNENILLEHAADRPLFGWGSWGRNKVYNPVSGGSTTTDGYWIIIYGKFGWLGYITMFGLMVYPIFYLNRKVGGVKDGKEIMFTAGACMMLAINLFDQIPNASINHLSLLLAGAIYARAKAIEDQAKLGVNNRAETVT